MKTNKYIDHLEARNSMMTALLKEILPMQGCPVCQNAFKSCKKHGDINHTIMKIRKTLSYKGDLK